MKIANAKKSEERDSTGTLKAAEWELAQRVARAIAEKMSPPGALGLPPLLEARRVRYGIPDEAFQLHATYDRVLLWQLEPRHEEGSRDANGNKVFAGTSIVQTESVQKRELKESNRGVIVSAGLKALDNLRSNGMGLGHIIYFVRLLPWHTPVGVYASVDQHLVVMRDGDVVASEDLAEHLKTGHVQASWVDGKDGEEGGHVFIDEDGKRWKPTLPWVDESF